MYPKEQTIKLPGGIELQMRWTWHFLIQYPDGSYDCNKFSDVGMMIGQCKVDGKILRFEDKTHIQEKDLSQSHFDKFFNFCVDLIKQNKGNYPL